MYVTVFFTSSLIKQKLGLAYYKLSDYNHTFEYEYGKNLCSVKFKYGNDCDHLIFIRHLLAIPTLVEVEMMKVGSCLPNLLVKDCLSSTDKVTDLELPFESDMVSITLFIMALTCFYSLNCLKWLRNRKDCAS